MSLYVQEGLQRVRFLLIKQSIVKFWFLILEIYLIHLCVSSTGFVILLTKFPLKIKLPSHISRNILTICVFQPLFISISCMRRFVSRGIFIFCLTIVFAHLIRAVGDILPSVKFVSSYHSSSSTSTLFQKQLLLDVWSGCFLFCIIKVLV